MYKPAGGMGVVLVVGREFLFLQHRVVARHQNARVALGALLFLTQHIVFHQQQDTLIFH
jgi:hypothetical protein